jgi:hypothetical protein
MIGFGFRLRYRTEAPEAGRSYGGISMNSKKPFNAHGAAHHRHAKLWVRGVQASSASEEKALNVFQPDILIGEQFLSTYRRRFSLQPEQELMLAVLQDAVYCFQENATAIVPRKQVLFREAEEWILSDDRSYLFSFANICDSLGLSTAYLRRGLMRWRTGILTAHDGKPARQQLAS